MNTNDKKKYYHFIGIAGIGMSGLAQMYLYFGYKVSGSDRAYNAPENKKIIYPLENQGIKIYPQTGEYVKHAIPDALIYSSAIEDNNPDFMVAPDIRRIHRAEAFTRLLEKTEQKYETIAVAGTCGKTTVSAWLAETLYLLNYNPLMLTGGIVNRFSYKTQPSAHCKPKTYVGNFYPGQGKYAVFEADESDKSLLNYSPDYAVILNMGKDHFSISELINLFNRFLKKVKKGIVLHNNLLNVLDTESIKKRGVKIVTFASQMPNSPLPSPNPDICVVPTHDFDTSQFRIKLIKSGTNEEVTISIPLPGIHNAENAAAVCSLCELIGIDLKKAASQLPNFKGVWRRFEKSGQLSTGAYVFDDYAHNPEKIASCLKTATEIAKNKVIAVFQPHGFGPLGFMKEEIFEKINPILREIDKFIFLPVFYAGGTTSFSPTSEEVVNEYGLKPDYKGNFLYIPSRDEISEFLLANTSGGDIILIMGARDNSLSDWAKEICKNRRKPK